MKTKKLVAPVLITCWMIMTLLGWLVCCFIFPIPLFLKLLAGAILLALVGVAIWMLVERIQEIESGEEDDLSNY